MTEQPTKELSDADELEALADWLDHTGHPSDGDEAQCDLRRIAAGLRQAVEALELYGRQTLGGREARDALAALNTGAQSDE